MSLKCIYLLAASFNFIPVHRLAELVPGWEGLKQPVHREHVAVIFQDYCTELYNYIKLRFLGHLTCQEYEAYQSPQLVQL